MDVCVTPKVRYLCNIWGGCLYNTWLFNICATLGLDISIIFGVNICVIPEFWPLCNAKVGFLCNIWGGYLCNSRCLMFVQCQGSDICIISRVDVYATPKDMDARLGLDFYAISKVDVYTTPKFWHLWNAKLDIYAIPRVDNCAMLNFLHLCNVKVGYLCNIRDGIFMWEPNFNVCAMLGLEIYAIYGAECLYNTKFFTFVQHRLGIYGISKVDVCVIPEF